MILLKNLYEYHMDIGCSYSVYTGILVLKELFDGFATSVRRSFDCTVQSHPYHPRL